MKEIKEELPLDLLEIAKKMEKQIDDLFATFEHFERERYFKYKRNFGEMSIPLVLSLHSCSSIIKSIFVKELEHAIQNNEKWGIIR